MMQSKAGENLRSICSEVLAAKCNNKGLDRNASRYVGGWRTL